MKEKRTENLRKDNSQRKAETTHQGFMFCPRCSHTVIGENVIGFCSNCGYRFCPSCSD